MNGTLELSAGPGGLSAGPFPASLGVTLAIGDTEPVTILLDKRLPAGPWDARIALRSGLLERSGRATITFPDAGASPPVKPTTSSRAAVAVPRRWPSRAAAGDRGHVRRAQATSASTSASTSTSAHGRRGAEPSPRTSHRRPQPHAPGPAITRWFRWALGARRCRVPPPGHEAVETSRVRRAPIARPGSVRRPGRRGHLHRRTARPGVRRTD